eukprot:m.46058 g.46058  ORF g.46058 m.46058 type:complete len:1422 (-) comp10707_c1_seq1:57-4322(-)
MSDTPTFVPNIPTKKVKKKKKKKKSKTPKLDFFLENVADYNRVRVLAGISALVQGERILFPNDKMNVLREYYFIHPLSPPSQSISGFELSTGVFRARVNCSDVFTTTATVMMRVTEETTPSDVIAQCLSSSHCVAANINSFVCVLRSHITGAVIPLGPNPSDIISAVMRCVESGGEEELCVQWRRDIHNTSVLFKIDVSGINLMSTSTSTAPPPQHVDLFAPLSSISSDVIAMVLSQHNVPACVENYVLKVTSSGNVVRILQDNDNVELRGNEILRMEYSDADVDDVHTGENGRALTFETVLTSRNMLYSQLHRTQQQLESQTALKETIKLYEGQISRLQTGSEDSKRLHEQMNAKQREVEVLETKIALLEEHQNTPVAKDDELDDDQHLLREKTQRIKEEVEQQWRDRVDNLEATLEEAQSGVAQQLVDERALRTNMEKEYLEHVGEGDAYDVAAYTTLKMSLETRNELIHTLTDLLFAANTRVCRVEEEMLKGGHHAGYLSDMLQEKLDLMTKFQELSQKVSTLSSAVHNNQTHSRDGSRRGSDFLNPSYSSHHRRISSPTMGASYSTSALAQQRTISPLNTVLLQSNRESPVSSVQASPFGSPKAHRKKVNAMSEGSTEEVDDDLNEPEGSEDGVVSTPKIFVRHPTANDYSSQEQHNASTTEGDSDGDEVTATRKAFTHTTIPTIRSESSSIADPSFSSLSSMTLSPLYPLISTSLLVALDVSLGNKPLGVTLKEKTHGVGLHSLRLISVRHVTPTSVGEVAGIQAGDMILQANDVYLVGKSKKELAKVVKTSSSLQLIVARPGGVDVNERTVSHTAALLNVDADVTVDELNESLHAKEREADGLRARHHSLLEQNQTLSRMIKRFKRERTALLKLVGVAPVSTTITSRPQSTSTTTSSMHVLNESVDVEVGGHHGLSLSESGSELVGDEADESSEVDLHKMFSEVLEQSHVYKKEVHQLREEARRLQQKISEKETENRKLQARIHIQLTHANEGKEVASSTHSATTGKPTTSSTNDIMSSASTMNVNDEEVDVYEKRVEELEAKLREKSSAYALLRASVDATEEALKDAQKTISTLRNESVLNAQPAADATERQTKKMKTMLGKHNEEKRKLQEQLDALRKKVKETAVEAKLNKKEYNNEIKSLKQQLHTAETTLETLTRTNARLQSKLADVERTVETLTIDAQETKKLFQLAEEAKEEVEKAMASAVNSVEEELKQKQLQLSQSLIRISELEEEERKRSLTVDERTLALEKEKDTLQKSHAQQVTRLEEKLEALEQQCASKETIAQALREELEQTTVNVASLEAERDVLLGTIRDQSVLQNQDELSKEMRKTNVLVSDEIWDVIESKDKQEIMKMLEEKDEEAGRLKLYVDQIMNVICDKAPSLLEDISKQTKHNEFVGSLKQSHRRSTRRNSKK